MSVAKLNSYAKELVKKLKDPKAGIMHEIKHMLLSPCKLLVGRELAQYIKKNEEDLDPDK
jgi:hypothetical protein